MDDRPPSATMVDYCFTVFCLAKSPWAKRIGRAVSGIEDNIETRCSVVHDRIPASVKAGSDVKPKRAILRDKAPASSI